MRKHGKIIIELRSDACIHSGYSYRGLIDNDVCCDRFGIPFIPARRLKGCMREAADMLKKHPAIQKVSIDHLFGERGQALSVLGKTRVNENASEIISGGYGNVIIENAHIPNYEQILEVLEGFEDTPIEKYAGKQDILAQYTSVRAQTRMVSSSDKAFAGEVDAETIVPPDVGIGCAMDNTLRFTRVINAHIPTPLSKLSDNKVTEHRRFESDIYYSDNEDTSNTDKESEMTDIEIALSIIAKAVRHIGLSRNRGLGNVTCHFLPDRNPNTVEQNADVNGQQAKTASPPARAIFFSVKNIEPLIISEENDNSTETYIPARNIRGALAWEYLSQIGNSANSEEFRHLFLDGTVRYTNLYIMDGEVRCIPAPGFVSELKKTKILVNALRLDEYDPGKKEEDPSNGNLPKKLKGKYISYRQDGTIHKKEVEREIIYHNRHIGREDEKGIYSQEVISEGQVFGGYIFCNTEVSDDVSGQLMFIIENLLKNAILRFGKSRSAQYGRCVLMSGMPKYSDMHISDILSEKPKVTDDSSKKKRHILVCLTSDGIFSENAGYTTAFDSVYKTIASDAGILKYVDLDLSINASDSEREMRIASICDTGTVYGFNSKWNLHKPSVPTVRAGSTFVYRLKEDVEEYPNFAHFAQAGEHRTEGYGELCMFRMSETELPYRLNHRTGGDIQKSVVNEGDSRPEWIKLLQATVENRKNQGANDAIELLKRCVLNRVTEEMRRQVMNDICDKGVIDLSSSTIGRVSLMLEEVRHKKDENKQTLLSPSEQFLEFAGRRKKANPSRILSLKRDKERKKLEKLIKGYFVSLADDRSEESWNLDCEYMTNKLLPIEKNAELRSIIDVLFTTEEREMQMESLWPEMMEMFLRSSKYMKKVSGVAGE